MESTIDPDGLHRLIKEALDSGKATSVAEAHALFAGYRLGFAFDPRTADSRNHQAALLSGVALARRVFLGGAFVAGFLDTPLLVPLPLGETLRDAVLALGGIPVASLDAGMPLVAIGGEARVRQAAFAVRATFAGWRGGIVPVDAVVDPGTERQAMPLAPLLAVALAVNEAFIGLRSEGAMAGGRSVGLSLWQPDRAHDWLADDGAPDLRLLPSRLWLIGLGHLGQAYLWALGLLPFPTPTGVELVLQDVDLITPSTESTSVLSDHALRGRKKTRAMADWCERRGFEARVVERLFDDGFRRQENEPAIALCGLDNALGRRALESPGFTYIVEAGLGRGYQDFRTLRVHTLPGSRPASELWCADDTADHGPAEQPAYQKLLADGTLDRCGITTLAGKAVGAPFVGAVAACLVIGEVLRLLHDGPAFEVIDLDLMSPEYRTVVPRTRPIGAFNPGYAYAAP